jgi:hypothetical protein
MAVSAALLPFGSAYALPTGEQVVAGQVTVTRPTVQTMQINQGTQKGIVNWQGFSIGASEHVNVSQLNASSVLLNRVVGNNPSEIFGRQSGNDASSSASSFPCVRTPITPTRTRSAEDPEARAEAPNPTTPAATVAALRALLPRNCRRLSSCLRKSSVFIV